MPSPLRQPRPIETCRHRGARRATGRPAESHLYASIDRPGIGFNASSRSLLSSASLRALASSTARSRPTISPTSTAPSRPLILKARTGVDPISRRTHGVIRNHSEHAASSTRGVSAFSSATAPANPGHEEILEANLRLFHRQDDRDARLSVREQPRVQRGPRPCFDPGRPPAHAILGLVGAAAGYSNGDQSLRRIAQPRQRSVAVQCAGDRASDDREILTLRDHPDADGRA